MIRKIIKIDKDKCNGCGLCVNACHEGAIGLENGKAVLLRDDYCDGLGDCLPVCEVGAISFEEREAKEYDAKAVEKNTLECGCPGTHSRLIKKEEATTEISFENKEINSALKQWPVQIKLVPVNAPYFKNANLLISADCAAYAYGDFHRKFMKDKITIIGCPKLDNSDYSEKLTAILKENDINSVTVVRMEVPCCSGIENAAKSAIINSKKNIPYYCVTITTDGNILFA